MKITLSELMKEANTANTANTSEIVGVRKVPDPFLSRHASDVPPRPSSPTAPRHTADTA